MSELINFTGGEDFYRGRSMEAGLFLSQGGYQLDFFQPRKRARVSGPLVVSGGRFEQNKQAPIDVLPDECLFEIFRRLDGNGERSACACVSKKWLMLLSSIKRDERFGDVVVDGDSMSEDEEDGFLTRSMEGKKATDVRLAAIAVGINSHGGLGELIIKGSGSGCRVTDIGLKAVARNCPSLRVLSLWKVPFVGDEGLAEIGNGCHRLEKLELVQCPGLTDKGLAALARGCPKLASLSVESCSGIGNEGLQAIAKFCPNLKSVSIVDCPLVGDQGIASVLSSATFSLTLLKLEALNVSDLSLAAVGHFGKAVVDLFLVNLQNVSERGFWALGRADGLQKLNSLIITSCRGVTDRGLESVGRGSPNLKLFSLSKSAFLSDNGLVSFAKAAGSLESVELKECHRITQNGFFGLLFNCGTRLKALEMKNCLGIRDMAFEVSLPDSFSTTLRSLSICDCPGFGNVNLAILAKLCPQLQELKLNGLHGITDDGCLPLIRNNEAGLMTANLDGCINLTDEFVLVLTELHGGTLELLDLNGCVKVTDASLVSIAENCWLLNDLDVSKCTITDSGLSSLARSKQLTLRFLSMSGCSMLSNKSLTFFVKLGQNLRGLSLQRCNGIRSTVIEMLMDRLPSCDILY